LYDSLSDPRFFRKFYARRALRILPLYYGVLLVFAAIGLVQHRSSAGELLSLALYMQNTRLIAAPIFTYHGPLNLPLGHFWSLAIEEQFYLAWPLLVFLLRTRGRLLLLCAAFMLLCPALRFIAWQHGADFFSVHSNTLYRADTLLAGGALALLLRSRIHDRVLSVFPWLSFTIILLPALGSTRMLGRLFQQPAAMHALVAVTYSFLAIGYVGILSMALSKRPARSLFSTAPLRFFGKYSYGLYVLHLIVLGLIEPPFRLRFREMHVSNGLAILSVGLFGLIVSMAAAYLSYQLYERPFLRLKRFFDYRPHGLKSRDAGLTPRSGPGDGTAVD
jgi:peptidoglycan/LPS O-acetylase OafA/YrhL